MLNSNKNLHWFWISGPSFGRIIPSWEHNLDYLLQSNHTMLFVLRKHDLWFTKFEQGTLLLCSIILWLPRHTIGMPISEATWITQHSLCISQKAGPAPSYLCISAVNRESSRQEKWGCYGHTANWCVKDLVRKITRGFSALLCSRCDWSPSVTEWMDDCFCLSWYWEWMLGRYYILGMFFFICVFLFFSFGRMINFVCVYVCVLNNPWEKDTN